MRVFGVSRDSHWSHRAWKDVLDVDVPLISDWNGALAKRYGAARVWRWMEDVPRRSGRRGLPDGWSCACAPT